MLRLKGKVAVITGGAGGIGLATAKLFLQEGAKVVIVDIDREVLEKAILAIDHENLSICVADVSKATDTEKFVETTLEVHGKIDIFFANAGIEGVSKPITEYPDEIFDKVIGVNLKGVWLGCKHVIPKMQRGGSVIITSSVAGLKGFAGLGAYVASKHAVVGLMRVAAQENAERKIRVNTIHPGPVNNNMMRRIEVDMSPSSPDEVMKGFEAAVPLGRYAESNEIAEMALFLASDESKYITGTTNVVDGGMLSS
ncbi:NAD(P)-dependent dehydrogenase, short-chain alcohol dehydrogenase family [Arenibacter palladensis]|uniref:NAD(P)-dependent dehydrogenase, short-chain alcohol dehydrogenase family n=1 Tax=Arenibacter palladensis TaxID=237373 RepID=A0A1M5AJV9_9FLAO|nr:SDR family NAD(P)-dependent oxidoreductase [Arenibacter palladensis]SHF30558.1 NAD(P)-dependent dehydrogenase, short-chain alcohol dehydrogenase family [Arenibacter palladensis]